MKNIDKIQAMSARELATFLLSDKCDSCSLESKLEGCYMKCVEGISEWLNQEDNPMPELETGDLVQTFNAIYVAVGNGKIVNPITMRKIPLKNVLASVSFIYRHDGNEYQEIWRMVRGEQERG